jgi:hypothetical protein
VGKGIKEEEEGMSVELCISRDFSFKKSFPLHRHQSQLLYLKNHCSEDSVGEGSSC